MDRVIFLLLRLVRVLARAVCPAPKPGPINALPPELLRSIFELFEFSGRDTLWSCMLVSRTWYLLARPHFLAIISVRYRHRKHFLRLRHAHPELAAHIKSVRLFDKALDDPEDRGTYWTSEKTPEPLDILLSTLPALTNLQNLTLVGFKGAIARTLVSSCATERQISLRRLSLENCSGAPLNLILGLLPLFSLDTLVTDAHWYGGFPSRNYSSATPTPVVIPNLVFSGELMAMQAYFKFFERVLVPGSVRALGIMEKVHSAPLLGLGSLLQSPVAQALSSISLDFVGKLDYCPDVNGNPDGIPTEFKAIGAVLAHCTRLQCVRIGYVGVYYISWEPSFRTFRGDAFAPIVANLPATLRAFAIRIWVPAQSSWPECCTRTGALDAVDRVLSPSGEGWRFPRLQRVDLHVHDMAAQRRAQVNRTPFQKHDTPVLPKLQAAGLLRFVHDVATEDIQPVDSVYWPPEMQH